SIRDNTDLIADLETLYNLEVDPLVDHTGNVHHGVVGEHTRGCGNVRSIQESVSFLLPEFQHDVHRSIEQSSVNTDVARSVLLPLTERIPNLRLYNTTRDRIVGPTDVVTHCRATGVQRVLVGRTDVLVTHHSPSSADLQVVEPGSGLHEFF